MLVSAGRVTLDGLDRVSIDDVQMMLIYLEWEGEERARLEEVARRKAEANQSKRRSGR
jgi:hypothetical protein